MHLPRVPSGHCLQVPVSGQGQIHHQAYHPTPSRETSLQLLPLPVWQGLPAPGYQNLQEGHPASPQIKMNAEFHCDEACLLTCLL